MAVEANRQRPASEPMWAEMAVEASHRRSTSDRS
jgi:hypothetical protein